MICCALFLVHFTAFDSFDTPPTYKVCMSVPFSTQLPAKICLFFKCFSFIFYTALELCHTFVIFIIRVLFSKADVLVNLPSGN